MTSSAYDAVPGPLTGRVGLSVLTELECLDLLRSATIGRLVFTDGALPAVQPMNFLVEDRSILLRTSSGATWSATADGTVVAFEVDELDLENRRGWDVTVVGRARRVSDPAERERMATLPLRSWAPGPRDEFVRIGIEVVSGRRLR